MKLMYPFPLHFLKYINTTSHLVLYQLKSQFIRDNLVFPNVSKLSLVHCNHIGIKRILKSEIFPNLSEIHYLSTHPGEYDIYHKLSPTVKWIFPNYSFGFYDSMMESGRGFKNDLLIPNHITDFKQIYQLIYFDLYLPNYGIMDGHYYLSLQNMFLQEKYGNELKNNKISLEKTNKMYDLYYINSPFKHYHNKRLDHMFMTTIMNDYQSELERIKLTRDFDEDRV